MQHYLIDIDRHQYLTPNDSPTRGKNRFFKERATTDVFGQFYFPRLSWAGTNYQHRRQQQTQSKN